MVVIIGLYGPYEGLLWWALIFFFSVRLGWAFLQEFYSPFIKKSNIQTYTSKLVIKTPTSSFFLFRKQVRAN